MQSYKNLSGNSGVLAYESGNDYIKVKFHDGSIYLYNYIRPGMQDVEIMKNSLLRVQD
jgi:hypothetical protein